jgi:hypothetical protein
VAKVQHRGAVQYTASNSSKLLRYLQFLLKKRGLRAYVDNVGDEEELALLVERK